MLTIKKSLKYVAFVLVASLLVLVGGCKPAGVSALYKGEKLIRQGEFERAVVVLQEAVSLLPTNALAFNYLGLAYHRNGQAREAHEAYTRALGLDRELAVARYNLGCLYLEQNNPDAAVGELTGYTMRVTKSVPGWLKLGNAHLQTTQPTAVANAYTAFQTVLEIEPGHPEGFNGLGLMEMKRHRARDALFYFNKALEGRPDFAAVHLNIAIVAAEELNDKTLALESYKKYLGMEPRPSNWDVVAAAARKLEQELEMEAASGVSVAVGPDGGVVFPEPDATTRLATVLTQTNLDAPPVVGTTNVAMRALESADIVQPDPVLEGSTGPGPRTEPIVTEMPVREKPDPVLEQGTPSDGRSDGTARARVNTVAPETKKAAGFRNRLQNRSTTTAPSASLPVADSEPLDRAPVTRMSSPAPASDPDPAPVRPEVAQNTARRYVYLSPPRAPSGNRTVAERFFQEGLKEQKAGRYPSAVLEYRKATQADPAYFEAFYNQGLAALELRDWKQSLAAYEYALAQDPNSADARYNFALALQQGIYIQDAASELNTLLKSHPGDARAHLSLANVYAKLGQVDPARAHYEKVLELNPGHPQSRSIRDWLSGRR